MNKLSILFLFLLIVECCVGQEVFEIIGKVKAKQATMVDIELEYEEFFKDISTDDSDHYIHYGYLLNRNGNEFFGKLNHCLLSKGPKGIMNDTVVELVQGVNAKKFKLTNPKIYSEYKTDNTLDPVFYVGVHLNDIETFQFEKQDSLFWDFSNKGTSHDNLGNEVAFTERIKIRKRDFIIVEYESILSMFGTGQYTKQKLISYNFINKVRKKELLKSLNDEFVSVKLDVISPDELASIKANIEKGKKEFLLKSGDLFPTFTGYFPDNSDSLTLVDIRDSIIVLDYFFTSCGPCMAAIPHLISLYEKYKGQGLGIYGIDPLPNDTSRLRAFKKKFKITYPVLKTSKEIPVKYKLVGYPTLFILNRKREIVRIFIGYEKVQENQIEEEIIKLLKR